jgi:hypothetical protein
MGFVSARLAQLSVDVGLKSDENMPDNTVNGPRQLSVMVINNPGSFWVTRSHQKPVSGYPAELSDFVCY